MKRVFKLLASVVVTLLFSWWAFRDTDWRGQWESLRSANYLWLIPYAGVLLAIHVCRTLRWGALLAGMERISFKKLNEASGIGFMMLIVLPFRLGEFARPFLIAQRSSVRRSAAMTTVVLERIVDGLSVATLLRILLFFVDSQSEGIDKVRFGSNVMFAFFGGGLAFLLFSLWQKDRAVGLVRKSVGAVAPRLADQVADVVDRFVGAMRQLPPRPYVIAFFAYTFAYWTLNGFGMFVLARAFDCGGAPAGTCQPLELSLFQAYVVLAVLVVALMIPSAPGMVGPFQWGIKVGLLLFFPASVVNTSGMAYANVLWLCQTGQQIGLGLILMSLSQLSFKELAHNLNEPGTSDTSPRTISAKPA